MNYLRNWVLAAYRAEHPNQRNPTELILEAFDQALFNRYDQELVNQSVSSIPLNPFNRSILVYFATRSLASQPQTKVKHAYEFFANTRPQP